MKLTLPRLLKHEILRVTKTGVWTSANELKTQVLRYWTRGDILRTCMDEKNVCPSLFPLRLKIKKPTSSQITDDFEAVRKWITQLSSISDIRIEWKTIRHSVLGIQRLPDQIWLDDLGHAAHWLGKHADVARFMALWSLTRKQQPELVQWLYKNPLRALELSDYWSRLLDVVSWIQKHPVPNIYFRQADIPGVDTKFIEAHRGVLSELFDLVLPSSAINHDAHGAHGFAVRYGFLEKPSRIRFRLLDEQMNMLSNTYTPDITLDATSFSSLALPVHRVFITENETNFLSFPLIHQSIVLFGAGYGWRALADAHWLSHCAIFYWGDIDTNGFAILNQLRHYFPKTQSFLMDKATLMEHKNLWSEEKTQVLHDLPLLTTAEQHVFNALRDNRFGKQVRLEQERIGFHWITAAIDC